MKKDREICSEWVSLRKPQKTQRETMFTENEYPHKDIYSLVRSSDPTALFPCGQRHRCPHYSLVRSSDLTVLFTADAKASGVSSRRNLNDLRVVLNKPSGGNHLPEGLKRIS